MKLESEQAESKMVMGKLSEELAEAQKISEERLQKVNIEFQIVLFLIHFVVLQIKESQLDLEKISEELLQKVNIQLSFPPRLSYF
jgi:hypothetical protein